MSELLEHRGRSPWLWPDIIYNLSPSGREFNKCLDILHGFTDKVLPSYSFFFFYEQCIFQHLLKEYKRFDHLQSFRLFTMHIKNTVNDRLSTAAQISAAPLPKII